MRNRIKVLCVDDEPHVLQGLALNLRHGYAVHTATSGADGLSTITSDGPFAVVLSDMRMPQMDGAAFLAKVREVAPDSVRMLLTGQTDMTSAIDAVNHGQIFRFLTKPCPPDQLRAAFDAATEQYRLLTAERELLDDTLKGAVSVLTDILSLVSPAAFSRASHQQALAAHTAESLGLENRWQVELAAMLAQIGCITLPPELVTKVYAGRGLSPEEKKLYASHPEVGQRLIAHIPRMESVAAMIKGQRAPDSLEDPAERAGAQVLSAALLVDGLVSRGATLERAVNDVRKKGIIDEATLEAMRGFRPDNADYRLASVRVRDLAPKMILEADVKSVAGTVVLSQGRELTAVLIERLQNFAHGTGVVEPIEVRIPVARGA